MAEKNGQPSELHRLEAEIGTIMLVTFARTTKPIKALFVGMEAGSFVILRFPAGAGVHDHLYEGNPVVVKYFSDGNVYGFQTQVLGYLYKKRLVLVVLSYPEKVEVHHLRKEQRIDFFVPAKLTVAGNSVEGLVVDISPGGCCFSFEANPQNLVLDFDIIKEVTLSFALLGLKGERDFLCRIMNHKQEGNTVNLGLQFEKVDESISEAITRYVRQVAEFVKSEEK
ncbi:MAG: flagellar brake protein [Pseudomonadota bacterium]